MIINKNNMLVKVSADELIVKIEQELLAYGYTFGFLPNCHSVMHVSDYLIGNHSGDLHQIVVGVSWQFPDGSVFHTTEAPHSAAGPDLKFAILKNEVLKKNNGKLLEARLRIFPIEQLAAGVFLFAEEKNAIQANQEIAKTCLSPYFTLTMPLDEYPLAIEKMNVKNNPSKPTDKKFIAFFFYILHPQLQKSYLEKTRDICTAAKGKILSGKIAENFYNDRFIHANLIEQKRIMKISSIDRMEDRDYCHRLGREVAHQLESLGKE